jgi:hypothetical protein
VGAQRDARVCDGLGIGVRVALGGDQRSVPGDLPEHVDRHTGIGHPGKAGVAQVVSAQMLVTELSDDLVPVGRVPQYRRGDPAATRTREDAGRRVVTNRIEASFDQRTDLFNQWNCAGPLAFCAFVDETAGAWCCLPPDRPGPGIAVDVGAPDAGHLADPGRGARGEDDDVAPAFEVIGRSGNERASQVAEGLPVGQRQ